ncbi:MAG: hypothetical protein AAF587_27060 [Bacteroidota bacterium]
MTLRDMILDEPTKARKTEIAAYIGDDQEKFTRLWQLIKTDSPPVPRLAAWIMEEVTAQHPFQVTAHLQDIIDFLPGDFHDGVRRNLVKILSRTPLPEDRQGELYDLSLAWLMSGNQPVAIKVWCMEICASIAWPYPELRDEVCMVIEEQMPFGSAGFRSRGKRILKRLKT